MIKRLLRALFGYYVLCIPAKYASLAINLLREKNLVFWGCSLADDAFRLCVTKSGYDCLQERIAAPSILFKKKGAPFFLYRYRSHVGLLFGALAALSLFVFSFSVVWDVRITGNERQSDQHILKTLEEVGLGVGARIEVWIQRKLPTALFSAIRSCPL